jgi:hypothetical protein
VAGNLLKLSGRPSALWIIVFLSDGGVNVSDVPDTETSPFLNSGLRVAEFPNGYCGILSSTVTLSNPVSLWVDKCVRPGRILTPTTRVCGPYHTSLSNCAPGVPTYTVSSPPYDAMDYALDMIDNTALRVNCPSGAPNPTEDCLANNGGTSTRYNKYEHPRNATTPAGSNLVIYSIGLGNSVKTTPNAEALLRYMAAVGDDGDRVTDPCRGAATGQSCGNYYFAAQAGELKAVFEDIAKRVFTRLSK